MNNKLEIRRKRNEWLEGYLGKFYESYVHSMETEEMREFLIAEGWKRVFPAIYNDFDEDDEFPFAEYTHPTLHYGDIPIMLQGLKD